MYERMYVNMQEFESNQDNCTKSGKYDKNERENLNRWLDGRVRELLNVLALCVVISS